MFFWKKFRSVYMKSMVLMKEVFRFAYSFLFVCLDINVEWNWLFFASSVKWVANFLNFYLVQSFIGLINCWLLLLSSFLFYFLSYKWAFMTFHLNLLWVLALCSPQVVSILYKKCPSAFICPHLKIIVGTKSYVYRCAVHLCGSAYLCIWE